MGSIDEIIEQFQNGRERFNVDPLFNNIVYSLAEGQNPLVIIDILVKMNNEVLEKLRAQLLK